MNECRQHGDVMARCWLCRRYYSPGKSRTLCDRDYWRLRRLREKTPEQLAQLEREADLVKTAIEAARHGIDDRSVGVAPSQPQGE